MLIKGDNVKFWDNSIGVVLNNGMPGKKFVEQYNGQELFFFSPDNGPQVGIVDHSVAYSTKFEPGKKIVWYEVLVGDYKVWITDTQVDRPMIKKL